VDTPRFAWRILLGPLVLFSPVGAPARQDPRAVLVQPGAPAAMGHGPRVALVIGNGAYPAAPLRNPVHDARAMAAKLKELGFEVVLRENLAQNQIGATLRDFRTRLAPGAEAVFFYAGHGLQVNGVNYLPAVDADITGEEDVPTQSIDVNKVLELMEAQKTRLNLVFLDACRNNPFTRGFRSTGGGLARVSPPAGTILSFATRPGSLAADGDGDHGLYTENLLQAMGEPGLIIEQALKRVYAGVRRASKGRQEPWQEGGLEGDFYFVPARAPMPAEPPAAAPIPAAAAPGPAKVRRDLAASMDFCWIPPGEFTMGSQEGEPGHTTEESPAHRVTLSRGFWLGRTEVTQGQYQAIMKTNPSRFYAGGFDAPVEQVTWDAAQSFIQRLNARVAAPVYRLPTEAEWEYACRAGMPPGRPDDLDAIAWSIRNSGLTTHPVGQKQANAWGLCDMLGNVGEWCQDWFGPYPGDPVQDPAGPDHGSFRVYRGGTIGSPFLRELRPASRGMNSPDTRSSVLGFRVVSLAAAPDRQE